MKKLIACCLCIFVMTLSAGCGLLFGETDIPDEENTDISEYTIPGLEDSDETPQMVLDAIAIIENTYADQGYLCEYIGDDMLKVGIDGIFYININEEEEDTDEAFYALRLFTNATDDPNADSEGTIAKFYVNKSTGFIYLMDYNSGTLTEMTVE